MKVGSTYSYFDGTTLVAVPGGPFVMGGNEPDNPQRTVTLSDFWIYSTKVTNLQYQQCVATGKCTAPAATTDAGYNDPDQQSDPVVGANWAQGEAYCEYANAKLPTEAQWEKAARGPNANLYPWGTDAPTGDLLNYNNDVGATTNVTNYPKGESYYDALDMEGNVFEWTWDWYDPAYYTTGPTQDPAGPDSGQDRSVRSAGFRSNEDEVLASTRSHKLPTDSADDLGFRCVVLNPTYFAAACEVPASVNTTPGLNCPKLNISVDQPSCNNQNYAVITLDDSTWPDPFLTCGPSSLPPGVTASLAPPGNHTEKVVLTNLPASGFNIWCNSRCQATAATCPPNYKLDPTKHVCVWVGGGVGQACPAGQQLDPSQMCCSSPNASFPTCPAGSVIVTKNNVHVCVNGTAIVSSVTVNGPLGVSACAPSNGGNPPSGGNPGSSVSSGSSGGSKPKKCPPSSVPSASCP